MWKSMLKNVATIATAVLCTLLILGALESKAEPQPTPVCGDVNSDGTLTLSDPLVLLNHMFTGAPAPACATAQEERPAFYVRNSLTFSESAMGVQISVAEGEVVPWNDEVYDPYNLHENGVLTLGPGLWRLEWSGIPAHGVAIDGVPYYSQTDEFCSRSVYLGETSEVSLIADFSVPEILRWVIDDQTGELYLFDTQDGPAILEGASFAGYRVN